LHSLGHSDRLKKPKLRFKLVAKPHALSNLPLFLLPPRCINFLARQHAKSTNHKSMRRLSHQKDKGNSLGCLGLPVVLLSPLASALLFLCYSLEGDLCIIVYNCLFGSANLTLVFTSATGCRQPAQHASIVKRCANTPRPRAEGSKQAHPLGITSDKMGLTVKQTGQQAVCPGTGSTYSLPRTTTSRHRG
jgi:hypothetical protein